MLGLIVPGAKGTSRPEKNSYPGVILLVEPLERFNQLIKHLRLTAFSFSGRFNVI